MNQPIKCNGCTQCCRHDVIRILPNEDASQWETMPHPHFKGDLALKIDKQTNNCVYLADKGCSIHGNQPIQCQSFDCRALAERLSYTMARKLSNSGYLDIQVWRKGRDMNRANPITMMEKK